MTTKRCSRCKLEKTRSDFHADRRAKNGLQSKCKACQKSLTYDWRRRNPEVVRETQRRSARRNANKRNRKSREYYRNNAEEMKARERARQRSLKDAAYNAYGGHRCNCCGESIVQFLCIDHVNNDGSRHRKEIGRGSIYYWLKQNGYPPGFQVLCANCNQGKQLNGGVCPHQASRQIAA